jgi:hypothetical protein
VVIDAPDARPDLLVVSTDSTTGWTALARELSAALRDAGARVATARTGPVPRVRTYALTDFTEARAARAACRAALERCAPGAIIYCSITSALLWPRPGAIWLDALAAENRPGRHGIWQRTVERRRLAQAPLVLPMSPRALAGLRGPQPDAVVVHTPVESSGPPGARDVAAVTYAGNPEKKRLDFILEQWTAARRGNERLVVAGADGIAPRDGVEVAGRLAPDAYRALLRRARVFVCAPLREDYGLAPLEALADGCQLVTAPAPGGFAALDIARALDPRLVGVELSGALRTALDDPLPGYAERAGELLAPYRAGAVRRTLASDVLPRLLTGWGAR